MNNTVRTTTPSPSTESLLVMPCMTPRRDSGVWCSHALLGKDSIADLQYPSFAVADA